MSTIATTTNTTPFIYPNVTLLDRQGSTGASDDGYLYALVKASTADTYTVYRSTNGGTSWASFVSFTRTGIVELGNMIVHHTGHVWVTYRVNESSTDKIYVRRLYVYNATWEGEFLVASAANGGVAGAVYNGGIDLHPVGIYQQWFVLFATGYTSGSQHGVQLHCMTWSYAAGATPAVNNGLIVGSRQYLYTGSGRIGPALDLEHTGGSGKGSLSFGIWLAFGRTQLHTARMAWNGYGWNTQNTTVVENASLSAHNYIAARWDGNRWVAGAMSSDTVLIYERNAANTTTTQRVTPAHPTGVVRNYSLSYNTVSGDLRVFAVGTSSTVLYYVDFVRATGLWTSWGTVSGSSILGTTGDNFGVRRGTFGDARYDTYYAVSGAPNTLTHTQQALSYAPNTPTWASPTSGAAADVAASLLLDWVFSDPDLNDAQSAYAVSRQVGAGALAYWRASDSTWQVAEVQNTSGTTSLTLASGWALASDQNYTYKVKVWDSASLASAYSTGVVVTPSAKVNPTVTAPTAAQVITTDKVTVTWTVAEQTQYRLQLMTNPGSVAEYDSGWVTSSATTVQIPYVLADNSGHTITLTTRNNEGLASNDVTRSFTVDFVEPMVPTLVATPTPASGYISVAITNPTPAGGAPALAYQDLYRRVVGDTSNGVRVAAGLASGAVSQDWRAASGVAYAYRALAVGVNGTSVYSSWTT